MLVRERKAVSRIGTGDSAFDGKMREKMYAFFDLLEAWTKEAWDPAMKALEDRTLINIEAMDLADKSFKKQNKTFEKKLKKLRKKWPAAE